MPRVKDPKARMVAELRHIVLGNKDSRVKYVPSKKGASDHSHTLREVVDEVIDTEVHTECSPP